MAREKGIFHISANYEPLKAAPFDARALVQTKGDLLASETWVVNGIAWIYKGMQVTVSNDTDVTNNGIYVLVDPTQYQLETSWMKIADLNNIKDLQNQINELKAGLGEDSAAGVLVALNEYKASNNARVDSLETILGGFGGENEPATVLDAINAIAKEIPIASEEVLGGIKLSKEVGINEQNQLKINELSTDKLIQGEDELVISGGAAK